jgi:hypothetical protein
MFNWTTRLSTIGAQAITVLMVMAAGQALTGQFFEMSPQGRVAQATIKPMYIDISWISVLFEFMFCCKLVFLIF